MFKSVDHVTIVVKDLDKAIKAYKDILGLVPGERGFVKDLPGTRLAMFTISGARVELMQPDINKESPFATFLKEHGEGVYSYCVNVEDFDVEIAKLKKQGIRLTEATQSALFPGYPFRIAWVPADAGVGVNIELVDYAAVPPYEKE